VWAFEEWMQEFQTLIKTILGCGARSGFGELWAP
jgi:hypothetical protein